jgi:S-formylglutathione hydrolase FrmB
MSAAYVPRREREQTEREERLRAALEAAIDDATDLRGLVEPLRSMVIGAVRLAGQERAGRVVAEAALGRAMDAIEAFDVRYPMDPSGAVAALRGWYVGASRPCPSLWADAR